MKKGNLNQKLSEKKQEVEGKKGMVNSKNAELGRFTDQLSNNEFEMEKIRNDYAVLQENYFNTGLAHDEKKNSLNFVESKLEQVKAKITTNKTAQNKLNREISQVERIVSSKRQDLEEIKDRKSEKESEISEIRHELSIKVNERRNIEEKSEELNEKLEATDKEMKQLNARIKENVGKQNKLEESNNETIRKIKRFTTTIDTLKSEISRKQNNQNEYENTRDINRSKYLNN